MEQIFKLHDQLSYGKKKLIYIIIAKQCNRQPNSVRNWFCSWHKVPSKFELITLNILENEHKRTDE